jgi:signal transduction histidine kinase
VDSLRFLHVIEGPDRGATFALPDLEPQLIGRSTEALPIKDQSVSRRHAELTPDGQTWFLRDLASTNGTHLNGESVDERVPLTRGDRITCGSTVFLFDETPEGGIPIRALEEDASSFAVELEHAGQRDQVVPATGMTDRLNILIHGTTLAVGTLDTHEYLARFLDLLVSSFSAEYAVALIPGVHGSGASSITIHRHAESPEESVALNRKLINDVRKQAHTVLANETRKGTTEADRHHWILAAPLAAGDRAHGVVYLEIGDGAKPSNIVRDDLELLHALAGQAGMAIERGELLEELLMRSRLAAMGETVAAISHGIKNILQGLRGGADAVGLAIDRGDLEIAAKGWTVLARNLDRIQALTMNMLGFARHRALEIETTSLEQLAHEASELLEPATKRASIEIKFDFPEDLPPIPIDSAAVLQALLNLLSNAVDVSPRGSSIVLAARYDESASSTRIDIIDAGSGIDPAVRENLFEPFVTTKGQRGTGLGLVVSRRIAERHGGTLECVRSGESGTVMRLELPSDTPGTQPGDTDGPRSLSGGESDVRFGPPEH